MITEWLLSALAAYGVLLLGAVTFFSCLALPVPSSLMMLTSGAFVASGDLPLAAAVGSAFTGAVLGDQAGYMLGRGGSGLLDRAAAHPKRGPLIQRARKMMQERGGLGVFFSRWLVSPLGPYVNLVAGAARTDRVQFTAWSIAGEAIWVSVYVGLGTFFASNIDEVAEVAGNLSGLLAALALTVVSGWFLLRAHRQSERRKEAARMR
ncbi:DedA family protein [Mesobacterium pallidum]|uniref:DedA family protein n=1 Tax=Mesobacterium pallidum TaxID=2872037 RepID=UPI001EE373AB|nr:DedA family protein [Mesobacterium pallidum]